MKRRLMFLIVATCAISVLGYGLRGSAQQAPASAAEDPASAAANNQAVLSKYCVTCHNERLNTADLRLDRIDIDHPGADADVWEKVVRKVNTGTMPPPNAPQPP